MNSFFICNKKKKLVSLWKCSSHLQYYKIDLNVSIKSQEIHLNVCEEFKTEREAGWKCDAKPADFFYQVNTSWWFLHKYDKAMDQLEHIIDMIIFLPVNFCLCEIKFQVKNVWDQRKFTKEGLTTLRFFKLNRNKIVSKHIFL